MNLIISALRRPITILVAVIGIALASGLALTRMSVDIFPNLNLPVIYVAQPYGGMDPSQMESYLVSYYEYHFLYVTGIEHVESRSIQNLRDAQPRRDSGPRPRPRAPLLLDAARSLGAAALRG